MSSSFAVPAIRAIAYADFQKIGLTIAKVVHIQTNSKAKIPSYLLQLDLGKALLKEHKENYKKDAYFSSAQLCSNHTLSDLQGQLLLCVYNFARKQIGTMMSDCLTTGVQAPMGTYEEKRQTTVFIRPSSNVSLGSRIELLGSEEVYTTNKRDLSWSEFESLDLRIGTLSQCKIETNEEKTSQNHSLQKIRMQVDLGTLGIRSGIGLITNDLDEKTLEGKQVLVLTNLCKDDLAQMFGSQESTVVLCTIAGRAVLEPAKKVDNGYRLA